MDYSEALRLVSTCATYNRTEAQELFESAAATIDEAFWIAHSTEPQPRKEPTTKAA